MSLFNPADLLNENIAANATKRDPLPIGETTAQIMSAEIKTGEAGPHAKNPGAPWARLDLKLEITDPVYLEGVSGQPDKVVTFLGVMLDMNNGAIATGSNKNIRLGKLRAATGTNGKPLSQMIGQYIRITIGHRPDPKDQDGGVLDEVTGYTQV